MSSGGDVSSSVFFFPVRKTSSSTVKHGWHHRSIFSGMTLFCDECWTVWYQLDPICREHPCLWVIRFQWETFQMHFFSWLFDILTWECSVAPGHGLCGVRKHRWYPNIMHEGLKSHLGEEGGRKNPGKSHEMTSLQTSWSRLNGLGCCSRT